MADRSSCRRACPYGSVVPETLDTYAAVLFDLDGVLTPTAEVHMRAWDEMFNRFLAERGDQQPYTDADYFAHVDGKPRYDGVRDMLATRDITLPEGLPDDPPEAETVCGLGNRKNALFSAILETDGVQPYPGSVHALDRLRERSVPVAVVSSSRNAPAVLAAAGLRERFDVVVDGAVAAAENGVHPAVGRQEPAPPRHVHVLEAGHRQEAEVDKDLVESEAPGDPAP